MGDKGEGMVAGAGGDWGGEECRSMFRRPRRQGEVTVRQDKSVLQNCC